MLEDIVASWSLTILLGACDVEYIEGAGDCPNSDGEVLRLGILVVIYPGAVVNV